MGSAASSAWHLLPQPPASRPSYARGTLETPASAGEERSFIMNDNVSACRGLLAQRVGVFHDQQSPGTYFMLLTSDAALVKALAMVFSSPWLPRQGRAQIRASPNSGRVAAVPQGRAAAVSSLAAAAASPAPWEYESRSHRQTALPRSQDVSPVPRLG